MHNWVIQNMIYSFFAHDQENKNNSFTGLQDKGQGTGKICSLQQGLLYKGSRPYILL